eukprot:scaffold7.g3530.t1
MGAVEQTPSILDLLLSQRDQGDGEGLTSAALQELLHKVDVRKEEVLLTLYALVGERLAAEAEPLPSPSGDAAVPAVDAPALEEDAAFSSALASLHERGLVEDAAAAQVVALAAQHTQLCTALHVATAAAAAARASAQLQQRLAELDAAVAEGRYAAAAQLAVELQDAVQASDTAAAAAAAAAGGGDGSAAAAAAADAWQQVEARVGPLRQQLLDAVGRLVELDPSTHLPRPAGESAEAVAALQEAWQGQRLLGLLPQGLTSLANLVLSQCVRSILAAEQETAAAATAAGVPAPGDSPASSLASTTLSRLTVRGDGRSRLERQLYKLLKAVVEQLLGGSVELAAELGPLLWPELAAAYVAVQLKPLRPQSDDELLAFSRRASLGVKLEQKAVKLGLLPPPAGAAPAGGGGAGAAASAGGEGPVTRYVQHTVGKLLAAKRSRFIAAARDLLASPAAAQETATVGVPQPGSRGTPKAGGAASRSLFGVGVGGPARQGSGAAANGGLEAEPPLLAGGEYVVTKAAQGAVALMREALSEACRSGNSALAQAMCGAVVDVAAMVVALPGGAAATGAGGEDAQLLPYFAALRYNDLHYVYQTLCNLPYAHAPRLQQLVHRNINFINPANRLRRAGEEVLDAMVGRQAQELLQVVEEFQCRRAVVQLLAGFKRLGGVLRGVLSPAAFVEVAGHLIQAVCEQITGDIMSLPDISVDDSEQIPRILDDLVSSIHEAVLSGGGAPSSSAAAAAADGARPGGPLLGGAPLEAVAAALEEATPAVWKLRELAELLDIRMVEIRQRWQEGRLPALGFSAAEVAHLVCALFEDTDLRRDFLALLEGEAML